MQRIQQSPVFEESEDQSHSFQLPGIIRRDRDHYNFVHGQRTKHFVALKPWYVMNPDSNGLATIWQVISAAAMAYTALVTPLQVCLLDISFDTLFVLSMCTDVVFLLDMVLQFFTTYARTTPSGVVWEVRLDMIAKHYVRSWFFFDLFTIIPFDLLGLLTNAEALKDLKIVKVIRTLRLVKLVRLLKSSNLLHRLEIPFSLPYQQFALLRFLSVLVLMCHWLACVWALTLQLVDRNYPQWIDDVEAVDGEFGILTRESAWRVYVASFYFCSYTMTSVGYGDFGPKNILERIVCTMMVMVSGLCWAYILGEVCAIVADMNADSQLFRKKMHQLNVMMRDQGLPYELRSRLRSFFLQNRHQIQYQKQLQLLDNMSPRLQAEVCRVLTLTWIRKVPFFLQFMNLTERMASRGMHTATFEACIADISRRLQCTAYAQADCFTNVQVLHILSKGLVALDNRFGKMGTVWGEDFVLADKSLIHVVNCVAMSYCEVFFLTRENFMAVVEARRSTCPELASIVRRYCVRIAVFRGILREARKRGRMTSLLAKTRPRCTEAKPSPPGFSLPGTIPSDPVELSEMPLEEDV